MHDASLLKELELSAVSNYCPWPPNVKEPDGGARQLAIPLARELAAAESDTSWQLDSVSARREEERKGKVRG